MYILNGTVYGVFGSPINVPKHRILPGIKILVVLMQSSIEQNPTDDLLIHLVVVVLVEVVFANLRVDDNRGSVLLGYVDALFI